VQEHCECGYVSAHTEDYDDDDHLKKYVRPEIVTDVGEIRQLQNSREKSNEK
jgi:hypothetical protein